MKYLLKTTLLVAGLAGNVLVYGQVPPDGIIVQRPLIKALRISPPAVISVPGCRSRESMWYSRSSRNNRIMLAKGVLNGDSVWIVGPDRMPCMVPSFAKTERMPVKKLDSRLVRPMPNGTPDGRPRVEVMPRRKWE